jgi:hypothetical protein
MVCNFQQLVLFIGHTVSLKEVNGVLLNELLKGTTLPLKQANLYLPFMLIFIEQMIAIPCRC